MYPQYGYAPVQQPHAVLTTDSTNKSGWFAGGSVERGIGALLVAFIVIVILACFQFGVSSGYPLVLAIILFAGMCATIYGITTKRNVNYTSTPQHINNAPITQNHEHLNPLVMPQYGSDGQVKGATTLKPIMRKGRLEYIQ